MKEDQGDTHVSGFHGNRLEKMNRWEGEDAFHRQRGICLSVASIGEWVSQ